MQQKINVNALRLGTRINWCSTWCECPKSFIKTFVFDLESQFFYKIVFDQLKLVIDNTRLKQNSKKSRSSGKVIPFYGVIGKWYSYLQNIPESSNLIREKNNYKQKQHVDFLWPFFGSHLFEYCEHTKKAPNKSFFNLKKQTLLPTFSGQLFCDYITNQISTSTSFKHQSFKNSFDAAVKKISLNFVKTQKFQMVSGIKITCSGKWKKTKSGRSQKFTVTIGRLYTQSVNSLTSYGFATSVTKFGCCGIKVWVNYKALIFSIS
jgi:hypothetical protein